MSDETVTSRAQHAQAHFIAMAAAFSLGVFNDNFFKQAALLIAIAIGRSSMQGWATAIFSLPFLLFAAQAGWLADRFPKRNIVIGSKLLELAAMICGAIGICMPQINVALILIMLGVMGLQATLINPALNASIAELYPAAGVLKANAVLRPIITSNVLAGVALAGFALARPGAALYGIPRGRLTVAVTVVVIAVIGVFASLGVPRRPAAAPALKFPWSGPLDTLYELNAIRKDFLLYLTLIADVFIWFAGTVLMLVINQMGMYQYQGLFGARREYATSGLVVAQLIGFAFGGGISGKLAAGERWHRVLVPGALAMAALMSLMPWVPSLSLGAATGGAVRADRLDRRRRRHCPGPVRELHPDAAGDGEERGGHRRVELCGLQRNPAFRAGGKPAECASAPHGQLRRDRAAGVGRRGGHNGGAQTRPEARAGLSFDPGLIGRHGGAIQRRRRPFLATLLKPR